VQDAVNRFTRARRASSVPALEEQRHLSASTASRCAERGDADITWHAPRSSRQARLRLPNAARRLNATELLLGDEPMARHGSVLRCSARGEGYLRGAGRSHEARRGRACLIGVVPHRVLLLLRRHWRNSPRTWLGAVRIGAWRSRSTTGSPAECRHVCTTARRGS